MQACAPRVAKATKVQGTPEFQPQPHLPRPVLSLRRPAATRGAGGAGLQGGTQQRLGPVNWRILGAVLPQLRVGKVGISYVDGGFTLLPATGREPEATPILGVPLVPGPESLSWGCSTEVTGDLLKREAWALPLICQIRISSRLSRHVYFL